MFTRWLMIVVFLLQPSVLAAVCSCAPCCTPSRGTCATPEVAAAASSHDCPCCSAGQASADKSDCCAPSRDTNAGGAAPAALRAEACRADLTSTHCPPGACSPLRQQPLPDPKAPSAGLESFACLPEPLWWSTAPWAPVPVLGHASPRAPSSVPMQALLCIRTT